MIKPIFCAGVFAASLALVGCDKAASVAGSAGSSAKAAGGEALTKARAEIMDNFDVKAIEEKISKMSGDAKATAETKLADFKKLVDEFKAAPMEKMSEWKDKLTKAFNELKTSVGF